MFRSQKAGTAGEENRSGDREKVRWRLVLSAGVSVAVLTYLLQQLAVFLYVFGPGFLESSVFSFLFPQREALGSAGAERFGSIVGLYLTPALHSLLVVGASVWTGRRVGGGALLTGALIGAAAAVVNQAIGLSYGPLVGRELVVYPLLGVAGGLLGGVWGWNIRSGEEALHRMSRIVGVARSPAEIAAAIGENLAGSEAIGVSLWAYPRQEQAADYELAGSWMRKAAPWPPEISVEAARVPHLSRKPVVVSLAAVADPERRVWHSLGVKRVLLVPLVSARSEPLGVLMVASRKRRGFSPVERRAYSTAASQSALALENLRLLQEARQAATLRERQRMAREIHDTLAQGFTSVIMNVEAAEGALQRNPQAVRDHHAQIGQVARESLAEARRLVWALRPQKLEHASLPDALDELAKGWSAQSDVACGVEVIGASRKLPAEAEAALLRCAQEALSNVRKHARAGRVALTLSYMGESAVLDVRDDGVGFDPDGSEKPAGKSSCAVSGVASGVSGGYGLAAMSERVERFGGTLTLESTPGEGTSLAVELPVCGSSSNGDAGDFESAARAALKEFG